MMIDFLCAVCTKKSLIDVVFIYVVIGGVDQIFLKWVSCLTMSQCFLMIRFIDLPILVCTVTNDSILSLLGVLILLIRSCCVQRNALLIYLLMA